MESSFTNGTGSTSRILTLAIEIASRLPYRYKHCAIVTDKKGKILGIGTNSYTKTHPKQRRYSRLAGQPGRDFLHAEVAAIIRSRKGDPYGLYVARADASGKGCNSKPCPVCEEAIREAGIREVIHT